MPRLQQHRFEARLAQAGVQPLRERPGFQSDAGQRQAEPREEPGQRLRLARHLGLTHNPPRRVDHAHAAPFQRDVDPGIVLHGCPSMMPGADPLGPRYTPSLWGQPPRRLPPAQAHYGIYEFLAIDRPLTEREMQELRAVSSRAVITATRFTNHYEWGNFKGDPRAWMERYFDAFLYFANWGTHELMLRLPRRVLDPATARRYCRGEAASARVKGEHVILEFLSEEEGSDWFEEDEDGSLSSLVPLRAEIAERRLARPLPGLAAVRAGRRAR